jgi:hypothetical protein
MHPPRIDRRHALLLGLAALFMMAGLVSATLMRPAPLDRAALARLAAEAVATVEEPVTTGSIRPTDEQMLMPR